LKSNGARLSFPVSSASQVPCRLSAQSKGGSGPTFTNDVAAILQRNCQPCHRPGEAAPFSLLTYEQARPWAKAIKSAVLTKKMPPWLADPAFGTFANDASLSHSDIDTLVAWVDAGAPLGDPKDMPPPRHFVEGWTIPKPDIVFQLPKSFPVPATGVLEYQYVIIPTGFTEDTWVELMHLTHPTRPAAWSVTIGSET
jgi:hypothetical protein